MYSDLETSVVTESGDSLKTNQFERGVASAPVVTQMPLATEEDVLPKW